MSGLVSIIMPFFDGERYIEESINTVIQQTYTSWELIAVNDKSPDRSQEIVEALASKDDRIKLINLEENVGPAGARNEGLKHCTGDFVAFLDADDKWLPEKLKLQMNFIVANRLRACYCGYYIIDENSTRFKSYLPPEKLNFGKLLHSNFIGNLTGIVEKEIAVSIGFEKVGHEDYIFWLKVLSQIRETSGLKQYLAEYRKAGSGISSNKIKTVKWQWHIYRNYANQNFAKSVCLMFFYAYYGLTKYKSLKD